MRFNPSGYGVESIQKLLPRLSDVKLALSQVNSFAAEQDVRVYNKMPIPLCMIEESDYPNVVFGDCGAATVDGECAVDILGNLKWCTLQKNVLGSVNVGILNGAFVDAPARTFRSNEIAFCRQCPVRDSCLGGCKAAAEWVSGSPLAGDPFLTQYLDSNFPATNGGNQDQDTRNGITLRRDVMQFVHLVSCQLRANVFNPQCSTSGCEFESLINLLKRSPIIAWPRDQLLELMELLQVLDQNRCRVLLDLLSTRKKEWLQPKEIPAL
jgi:radical SAM protein with 4Fe4S-binding SPASM domain